MAEHSENTLENYNDDDDEKQIETENILGKKN